VQVKLQEILAATGDVCEEGRSRKLLEERKHQIVCIVWISDQAMHVSDVVSQLVSVGPIHASSVIWGQFMDMCICWLLAWGGVGPSWG